MLVVDTHEVERIAVGAMLATVNDDLRGLAGLLESLTRDELIGALTYCARFASAYARRSVDEPEGFAQTLSVYAQALASRPAEGAS